MAKIGNNFDNQFITEYSVLQQDKIVHQVSPDSNGQCNFNIRIGIGQLFWGEAFQKLHIDLHLINRQEGIFEEENFITESREADIPPEKRSSFTFEANYSIKKEILSKTSAPYLRITVFILNESLKDGSYLPFVLLDTALLLQDVTS
ncbi:hypothetical protein [Lapidilactobacillus luobeiensis]|uniref:hypothetical protein n=1 Tax=Lapidilactobacillus luobeiensis TaxID=2950371 RepID=UPI0021C35F00|nr:hypothetical protein [Lapidilactobacillus luobeiensis]